MPRVGFAHIGTLRSVGFKHGRWLDTVLMQRPLGGGDQTPPCSTRQWWLTARVAN